MYYIVTRHQLSDSESDSGSSDSSDEDDGDDAEVDERTKGPSLVTIEDFDSKKLSIVKCEKGSFQVAYDNNTCFFIRSGTFTGEIQTFTQKYCNSILVKKGELLEQVRAKVEKLLGKKSSVNFYGKNESPCGSFFPDCVLNSEKEKCLHVYDNKEEKLIPINQLDKRIGSFTVMLKSGRLTEKKHKEYNWKLTVVEAEIAPIPKQYENWFRKVSQVAQPKCVFFK